MRKSITIIVPVLNEEESVEHFISEANRILPKNDVSFDILFVDDGSTDQTIDSINKTSSEIPVSIVKLSRNFGKDNALCAGLSECKGNAAIPMDVDMQDPLEVVGELIGKWNEGFDVVRAKRTSRDDEGWFKKKTAGAFYRVINKVSNIDIPENVGDFRLIDRKVIDVVNLLPEKNKFMKGLFAWAGFKTTDVEYKRPDRFAGTTKWNYFKLWNFALDGIVGFSSLPIKLWSYVGLFIAGLSFSYGTYILIKTLVFGVDLPGYASMITLMAFGFGLILLTLGVIGEYIARIYEEVKNRPSFVIDEVLRKGFDEQ